MLAAASPVQYVDAGDPPFLILQGAVDTTVPPSQSQELATRLHAAGVPVTLVMVQHAGHGFKPTGRPVSPSLPQLQQMTVGFFVQRLASPVTQFVTCSER